MAQVPTGSLFFVATAYGASQSVTSASNASEAVITVTAHGYSNGDIVEMTSGWGRMNLRNFRVKGVTSNTFILEGFDTTNTTYFPAGTGIGSVRKINTFQQITGVMSPSSSGGDPKNVEYKFLESDVGYLINDGFSATSYSINLDADQIGSAGYTALQTLTNTQTNTALKILLRSGSFILVPCTVALNEAVSFQDGQINQVKCSFNGNNKATRY